MSFWSHPQPVLFMCGGRDGVSGQLCGKQETLPACRRLQRQSQSPGSTSGHVPDTVLLTPLLGGG